MQEQESDSVPTKNNPIGIENDPTVVVTPQVFVTSKQWVYD